MAKRGHVDLTRYRRKYRYIYTLVGMCYGWNSHHPERIRIARKIRRLRRGLQGTVRRLTDDG